MKNIKFFYLPIFLCSLLTAYGISKADSVGILVKPDSITIQNNMIGTGYKAFSGIKTITFNSYTLQDSDHTILLNQGSGSNAYLTTAVGKKGRIICVKNIHTIATTLNTCCGETLDGDTQHILSPQYHAVSAQSDGTNWFIIFHTP